MSPHEGGTGPLLAVRDLVVDYGGTRAVDGVSLEVRDGEVVGLVGASGSGKTTLALSVMGLLPAAARVRRGQVAWRGEELLEASGARLRGLRGREIAMVFQEPLSALHPAFSIAYQVAEAVSEHRPDLSRAQARREAVRLLSSVGVADPAARATEYPHQWSGGMRQRALIAMALAHGPALLIADEPTTALDVTVQARIIELMRRTAPAAQETAVAGDRASGSPRDAAIGEFEPRDPMPRASATLLITHDFGLVAELADRVLVMHDGRIVEQGGVTRIFDRPEHPRTLALLGARPGRKPTTPSTPAKLQPSGRSAPGSSLELAALEVRNLSASYEPPKGRADPVVAVRDVDLHICHGEILGLVGESGSGKSSLARALVGLLPSTGRIRVAGRDLPTSTRRSCADRRALQIVFQDPFGSLNPRRSVEEAILDPLRIHRLDRDRRRERAIELLEVVELDAGYAARLPAELSGGERQRVAIARALACRPQVLILDEPVTSLDLPIQVSVLALLRGLCAEVGTAFLLIAHDLRMVRDVADRVGVMQAGRLVETGTAQELFERPRDPETRRLLAAIPADHPSQRASRLASSL